MWPAIPVEETPISHITNGVHARTWVSDRVDELLSGVVGDDWHLAREDAFERVRHVDHRRSGTSGGRAARSWSSSYATGSGANCSTPTR